MPLNSESPPGGRPSAWSHLLLVACAAFVLTVFLMVAAALNRQAAALSRFFDLHGMLVLAIEVGSILALALIVLVRERRATLRRLKEREAALLLRFAESTRQPETPSPPSPVRNENEPSGQSGN